MNGYLFNVSYQGLNETQKSHLTLFWLAENEVDDFTIDDVSIQSLEKHILFCS